MEKVNGLKVSNQFFSIQGEGRYTGVPSFFLRLTACNLLCGLKRNSQKASWTCDTFDVWKVGKEKSFKEIADDFGTEFFDLIFNRDVHLILTGGEPLLQQENLIQFLQYLDQQRPGDFFTEIETNGTIDPDKRLYRLIDQWNVSPKLSNSGEPKKRRYRPDIVFNIVANSKAADVKFVVTNEDEWREIEKDYLDPGYITRDHILLMPGAENRTELEIVIPIAATLALRHSVRLSNRLQIALWNQTTGV